MAFDPLKNHPLGDALTSLLALEGNESFSEKNEALSEENLWSLERIFYFAHDVAQNIPKIRAVEFNINAASGLSDALVTARDNLQNYLSNRNIGHISSARTAIDGQAVPNYRSLLPPGADVHPRTSAALEIYRKQALAAKADLKSQIADLNSDTSILQSRLAEREGEIEALKGEIAEQRGQNGSFLEEFRSEMRAMREGADDSVKEFFDEARTSMQAVTAEATGEAQTLLENLQTSRDEAA